jgi:lipopolysaccharide/colanic/teichoic acid biosynthesis glycosyltransferase
MGSKGKIIRRLGEIIISSAVLLFFSPVILLAVLAIRIESKGSAFFLHERVGYLGKKFRLCKLRGMVQNALEIGPEITQADDPRITKVGKFLRRTSIDEIPNFLNVLKGEMVLVGPRPEVESVTSLYSPSEQEVFNFKPGVTGISQINGRQMLTPCERVKMEIEYYKNATFKSDLMIVLKTFRVIWNNSGNL